MIEVYGKVDCNFCDQAISLLETKNLAYTYTDVLEDPDAFVKLRELGIKTVPAIWIDGEFIGGYTQLKTCIDEIKYGE